MKRMFYLNLKKYAPYFILVSICLLATFTISVRAQYEPWTQNANLNIGRIWHATGLVNNKIYIVGGRYNMNLVTEYDAITGMCETKANMPTARCILSSCTVNDKIYAIGGLQVGYQPAITVVEEYNTATDTWTAKAPMATPRFALSTCVLDGKIYAIGGMTSGSNFWSGMRDTVEVYDPVIDTWSIRKNMPTKRCWFTTSVVNGKIYAIGGMLVTKEHIATVEEYDPVTDTWTTKSPMPTERGGHVAAVVDGIIYVMGGGTQTADPGGFSMVEAYDPVTDTWTKQADLPAKRAFAGSETIDKKIYVISGIRTFADPHLHGEKTVFVYDPSKDLTASIDQLNLNKCYVQAGNDSVCITAAINDTSSITLYAAIESPDQTRLDSLQLFDDGLHNDGEADDNIFSNIWPVNAVDEKHYYIDLNVTKAGEETVMHYMKNIASFTTIGPVVLESSSNLKSPVARDKWIVLKCTLANKGLTSMAPDIKAKIISHDTSAIVTTDVYYSFGDISSGESVTASALITITETCPGNTPIPLSIDITSNGYSYWSDTFSIVIPSATISEENTLQQSDLIQNYPNPCHALTTISFHLYKSDHVSLKVYNSLGKEIKTLVNNILEPGDHAVSLYTNNLEAGMYIYKLKTGNMVSTKKMIVIR